MRFVPGREVREREHAGRGFGGLGHPLGRLRAEAGFGHGKVRALSIHREVPASLGIDARIEHGLVAKALRERLGVVRRLDEGQGLGGFDARFGERPFEQSALDDGLALWSEAAERAAAAPARRQRATPASRRSPQAGLATWAGHGEAAHQGLFRVIFTYWATLDRVPRAGGSTSAVTSSPGSAPGTKTRSPSS